MNERIRKKNFRSQAYVAFALLIVLVLLILLRLNFSFLENYLFNPYLYGFLLVLPLILANASPVLMQKIIGEDILLFSKKTFRNKPLFGSRTVMGLFNFIIISSITGQILFSKPGLYALLGLLSFVGTCINSFIKRQFNLPRGKSVLFADQVDFLVLPLLLLLSFYSTVIVFVALLWGLLLHVITDVLFGKLLQKNKEIAKIKYPLLLTAIVLALLFTNLVVANFIYLIFYHFLYGTSLGKTILFLGTALVLLIPFKIKMPKKLTRIFMILFILIILFIAGFHYISAKKLNTQFVKDAGFTNDKLVANVLVYDGSSLKYSATNLFHSHLFKSILSMIPIKGIDLGNNFATYLDQKNRLLVITMFLLSLASIFMVVFSKKREKRLKFGLLSIVTLITSIDGGLLTPQFILFIGILFILLIVDLKKPKNKYLYWGLGLIPIILLTVRNILLQGAYPLIPVEMNVLFLLLPFTFLVKKKFFAWFIFVLLTVGLLHTLMIPKIAEESSITYSGNSSFNTMTEQVFTGRNIHTIRFYTNNSWSVYHNIYKEDKGESFQGFLAHKESCYGIKEMQVFVKPDVSFDSDLIRVIEKKHQNNQTIVDYTCACSDCGLIYALLAKENNSSLENVKLLTYNSFPKKSFKKILFDSIPWRKKQTVEKIW